MKKPLIGILMFIGILIISSCATQKQSIIHNQKRGLMIWDNTEMPINKKYHSRENQKKIRKSRRKSKRRY
jgi:hypothetical protein